MFCVYLPQSEADPNRLSAALGPLRRFDEHNSGKSMHTNKYRPWQLAVSVGFADNAKALRFERYHKSGSGRAFAKTHF